MDEVSEVSIVMVSVIDAVVDRTGGIVELKYITEDIKVSIVIVSLTVSKVDRAGGVVELK